MATLRRGQALGLAISIIAIYFLFFAGSDSGTDFRRTTEASLSLRRGVLRGSLSDADLTAQTNRELQRILDLQREALDQKALRADRPTPGSPATPAVAAAAAAADEAEEEEAEQEQDVENIPVAGRKIMPVFKDKPQQPVAEDTDTRSQLDDDDDDAGSIVKTPQLAKPKDDADEIAREELQAILKKSPIIIFSKSYCPYSKRAKALLLETYTIIPTPYVVELDLMNEPVSSPVPKSEEGEEVEEDEESQSSTSDSTPLPPTLGRKLQDLLASLTGRRTVPNIMVNAQSIGGSDDIVRMHEDGTLEAAIKRLGGKRIVSVEKANKANSGHSYP
ncbi:hypothetical protein PV10_08556 [Exophiala mesophila]|uniref:Uncharacterized protein n=1 Tax=Exophiala mesophila TaxID=212818 RepID=A0A0D1Z4T9_EXOME|nr:uncharacterized protein PV10_08556 [Exophiala mesophila]KIV88929.1 hypothetical protein PV10_08556 [Exophiala mesophila]